MKKLLFLSALFAVGIFALLASHGEGQQQPLAQSLIPDPPEGVEPQTRGPVHEAFVELHTTISDPFPIVPKQPPEPIEEVPPEQQPEGDNVVWIPGYWGWDEDRVDFMWISGFWRDVPPGRAWVPGYWAEAEEGWQWVSGYWAEENRTEFAYLPPPPEPIESGPSVPAPSAESVYVPGIWVYRETRYFWRPGFWITQPVGWVYVPARYCWTPSGYLFLNGYWDYPVQRRGILFCPVVFSRAVYTRPGWTYRPTYTVPVETMFTCLFARPRLHHYYFGDYFHATYLRSGYTPWFNHTVARGVPNPLFSYYRAHRDRGWATDLRQVYVARLEGTAPRPPATWREQVRIIQNIQNVTTTNNVVQINQQKIRVENPRLLMQQMSVATPLNALARVEREVKLQPVNQQAIQQGRQRATQFRQVAQQRRQADVKLARSAPAEGTPRQLKLTLPQVEPSRGKEGKAARAKAPPPPPDMPKQVVGKGAPAGKAARAERLDNRPLLGQQPAAQQQPEGKGKRPPVTQLPEEKKKGKFPATELPEKKGRPPVTELPEKKGRPPVTRPLDEKGKPPVTLPPEGKKGKPPATIPPLEKKGRPPTVQPQEEKKGRPPVKLPPDEKKGRPPVQLPEEKVKRPLLPREEKKEVRPPVPSPRDGKGRPDFVPSREEKRERPPTVPPREEKRPVQPRTEPQGRPLPREDRDVRPPLPREDRRERPPAVPPREEKRFAPPPRPEPQGRPIPQPREDRDVRPPLPKEERGGRPPSIPPRGEKRFTPPPAAQPRPEPQGRPIPQPREDRDVRPPLPRQEKRFTPPPAAQPRPEPQGRPAPVRPDLRSKPEVRPAPARPDLRSRPEVRPAPPERPGGGNPERKGPDRKDGKGRDRD